ncbi:phosphocholine cytidylyltransferase family protein [Accumulibacter sp.]|uniref:phosphocholine cytidylyltransferase family protein n=1 Tax=Accumulibacter sp. TaxID=2053492 RepID=UPI0025E3A4FB|nr:phosphocholine cytidylyltransferase family protein [Accumulibacter sp.]MCM8594226.1 phosphocholine cytidylyltransferase family protein [Accumulibacter sp.]MCM8625792.1 phosphocholine cytidylyltransferase family protein [Accumulibacter sp.]MDS4048369.1 phosphocholine cytidylyltransferase family protein [Accumulibacter sp.]
MKALILAAGQGSRLRPLTDDIPKCLVELGGKSLLERQATVLRRAGIRDIIVVSGYRADQIAARGFATRVNPRYATTNMVATLFCAADLLSGSDDLLICYGDIVYEGRVLAALLAGEAPFTVMIDRQWLRYWRLRLEDPLTDAETLKLGPGGRLRELGKKPRDYSEIEGQYMGLIKVRADHVERLREVYGSMDRAAAYDGKDFDNMYMTSFIQYLIDHGWDVRIAETDNGWLEVDSVSDLRRYEAMAADGTLAPFYDLRETT